MARYELVALNTSTPQLEAAQSGDTYLIPRTAEMETGAELRVYNTADMDTNYERGFMRWSGNALQIGSEKGGSGTVRNVEFYHGSALRLQISDGIVSPRAHTYPVSDNTYTLGVNTNRWKQFFLNEHISMAEMAAPSGVANNARIFAQDNGGGKTQLMVIFGSGAAQQLAIEP